MKNNNHLSEKHHCRAVLININMPDGDTPGNGMLFPFSFVFWFFRLNFGITTTKSPQNHRKEAHSSPNCIILCRCLVNFSEIIHKTEFIQCLILRDTFSFQFWHTHTSPTSYLFVMHATACVVRSPAHSPKAWITILIVNHDKDFLYVHPINTSALIMHHPLRAFAIRYSLAGSWQAWMFTFTTSPPPLLLLFVRQTEPPAKIHMKPKSTNVVLTSRTPANKWHHQLKVDMQRARGLEPIYFRN